MVRKFIKFISLRTEPQTHLWVKTLRVSAVISCNRTKVEYASAPRLPKSFTAGKDFARRAQHPCKQKHLFKQVTMATCTFQTKSIWIGVINKNPIRFNVTISTGFPLAHQRMIPVPGMEGLIISKFIYHGLQLFDVLAPFSHPSNIL